MSGGLTARNLPDFLEEEEGKDKKADKKKKEGKKGGRKLALQEIKRKGPKDS